MAKETIRVGKHYLAISLAVCFFFIFGSVLAIFGLLPHDIQQAIQPNPISFSSLFSSTTPTVSSNASGDASPGVSVAAAKSEEPAVQYERGVVKETPLRVSVPKIGIDVMVKNPTSTNAAVLNEALMEGAVRYPGSGLLGESKNVFLFGHSAYSHVIKNRAYHTFDGLEKLQAEDEIYVEGNSARYVYKVVRVSFLKDSDAYIDLETNVRMLTLSTCNAFGAKDDRVVVQARFVKQLPLVSAN